MSSSNRDTLVQSLKETIADYRKDEIAPISTYHIERWLAQFEPQDQFVILIEMDAIMKRFYFSKNRVKECLRTFLKDIVIEKRDPLQVLPGIYFLNIQKRGNSQRALLKVMDEILHEDFGLSIAVCGTNHPNTFVYIDDCLYTGSHLRYDLTSGEDIPEWIVEEISPQATLIVYNIVVHLSGLNYVDPIIRSAARKKGITVLRKYSLLIDNRRNSLNTRLEVLWPEPFAEDALISNYTSHLITNFRKKDWSVDNLFRLSGIPGQETLFSSIEARTAVERAFLKKGIPISLAGQIRAESLRPLGFEKISSLGFGTFFSTYLNIANNCPLVLWWGDPTYPTTHPLGMWYPLLPRRTNRSI